MEVVLQYLDEVDDAWFSLLFRLSRPWPRALLIGGAAVGLASCVGPV
ncbi:MAG: hypothetical protein AAFX58_01495 [Pseudomonadota bacterium]